MWLRGVSGTILSFRVGSQTGCHLIRARDLLVLPSGILSRLAAFASHDQSSVNGSWVLFARSKRLLVCSEHEYAGSYSHLRLFEIGS